MAGSGSLFKRSLSPAKEGPWAALPHPGLWGNVGQELKGSSREGQMPIPPTGQPFGLKAQAMCFDVSGPGLWRVVTSRKLAPEERTQPCPEAGALTTSRASGSPSLRSCESYGWKRR